MIPRSHLAAPSSARVGRARGFTLVELLVAITAGLFVAIAAFAMARQGSRFFQQEARVANAQYAATLGFDRLRADLARAAFLSTPNINNDRRVCPEDRSTWVAELTNLKTLSAVRLELRGSVGGQDATNGVYPDRIVLAGSYSSAELFPTRLIQANGNKFDIYLQVDTGAMGRTTGGTMTVDALQAVFARGRGLRILDNEGRFEFGVIDSVALSGDGTPIVTLAADPPLPFRQTKPNRCGVVAFCTGCQASVINWIVYELRNLSGTPGYAPIYAPTASAPGDESRLELVRYEQDAKGAEMAGSLELVAEYAIDLKFAFTVVTDITNGTGDFGSHDVARYDFDAAQNAAEPPEHIRSIRARLAVRSREGDRLAGVPVGGGNLYRYQLPDAGFARVRTVTAEVQVPNLAGFTWK